MTWFDSNREWLSRAARWQPKSDEALRLRAWMREPVAWDGRDTVQIEGALQHAVVRRESGRSPDEVFGDISRSESERITIPVPICDIDIAAHKIARASSAWPWPLSMEGTRYRNKRARHETIGTDTLNISGGPYKSLRIPVAVLHTPILDFFVRGDRAMIQELLVEFSCLARDGGRGLGGVEGWEIDPDPFDRSLAFRRRPMRPLPLVEDVSSPFHQRHFEIGSFDVRESTVRAPYWRDWMRIPSVVPIIPVGDEQSWWADAIREEMGR